MEIKSEGKGVISSVFKINDKSQVYIEVSNYKKDDQERIYDAIGKVTPNTPEQDIHELFEGIDCTLRTKSYFVQKRKISRRLNIIYVMVSLLCAAAVYMFTIQ